MTKLDMAKSIRDNNYSCNHFTSDDCETCPLYYRACGFSDAFKPGHATRVRLIEEYIAKHDKETKMKELEKAIEENRKAGEELQRKLVEYKNRKEIYFNCYSNWGCITNFGRYILSVNGEKQDAAEWKDFSSCIGAANGCFSSGQEAIDKALSRGWEVVELGKTQNDVSRFLLRED